MSKLSTGEKAFVCDLVERYSLRGLLELSVKYQAYANKGNTIARKILPLIHIAIFDVQVKRPPRWN